MPYTNDTATLADVVSPVDAAMQSGQAAGYGNILDAVKANIAQQTAPAEIQKASLLNQLYQAQAQSAQGMALQNQAKGLTDMQAQPSEAAATIGGNQAKLSTDQLTKMNNFGTMVGQVANYMDSVPPAARPAAMAHVLQSSGINNPELVQGLTNMDPNQLPDALRGIQQRIVQMGSDYQTKQMQEREGTARSLGVAQVTQEGRVNAATQGAQARIQAAQISAQARQMSQNFEQAAVAAERAGNHAEAQRYYQAAQNVHQMAAQTTAGLVGVQQPSPGFGDQGGDQPVNAAPAQSPAGAPSGNAIADEMRKRGLLP